MNQKVKKIKLFWNHTPWFRKTSFILLGTWMALTIFVLGFLYVLSFSLPSLEALTQPKYKLPTQVYDRNNKLITEFYTQRRVLIPFKKVPDVMIQALLSIEDSGFYSHFGISPIRMVQALVVNIVQNRRAQGASTLTQQTAKMFLLTAEKEIIRKLREILLAFRMETKFSKNKILELYLNKAYFGHGAYGIEAAAQGYFGKSTEDLNLVEAALIAGLPKAPSQYAPTASLERATTRRNLVLRMMKQEGYITEREYQIAISTPVDLRLNNQENNNETSYYMEHLRKYLAEEYGFDQLYRGGLKVYTTMDLNLQIFAQHALMKGLEDHDKRQGYRGAVSNLWDDIDKIQQANLLAKEASADILESELRNDASNDENNQSTLLQGDLLVKDLTEDSELNTQLEKELRLEAKEELRLEAEDLYEQKLEAATDDNRFTIGGRVLGVVTNVTIERADVTMGTFDGKLYLDTLRWARPVDYSEKLSWKNKLKDLNEILQKGDLIWLKILDYIPESQEFVLALSQRPSANGSILSMNPNTGHVLAMSGGYDFRESEFNRALQSKRQTGSAFKPIVYSLALDGDFTRATMLSDAPIVDRQSNWRPVNDNEKYKGAISLRDALTFSKNIPTIRLTWELGIPEIIKHARNLGITAVLPEDSTLGLGTGSITLDAMLRTYSIFANGGDLIQPLFLLRVEDPEGNILEEAPESRATNVLSESTAFLTTKTLKDVVDFGTGWRAKAIQRPAAGKTGTTNNYTDAWFIGYVPQIITGVYVGFDDQRKSLGQTETGSRAAAPIWVDFMKQATATLEILPFQQPEDIKIVRIKRDSGYLDCDRTGKNTVFEFFRSDTVPTECHQALEPTFIDPGKSELEQPEEETNSIDSPEISDDDDL